MEAEEAGTRDLGTRVTILGDGLVWALPELAGEAHALWLRRGMESGWRPCSNHPTPHPVPLCRPFLQPQKSGTWCPGHVMNARTALVSVLNYPLK